MPSNDNKMKISVLNISGFPIINGRVQDQRKKITNFIFIWNLFIDTGSIILNNFSQRSTNFSMRILLKSFDLQKKKCREIFSISASISRNPLSQFLNSGKLGKQFKQDLQNREYVEPFPSRGVQFFTAQDRTLS